MEIALHLIPALTLHNYCISFLFIDFKLKRKNRVLSLRTAELYVDARMAMQDLSSF